LRKTIYHRDTEEHGGKILHLLSSVYSVPPW
jgi:hypothetical protein